MGGFDEDDHSLAGIGIARSEPEILVEAKKRPKASANVDHFSPALNGGDHFREGTE